MKQACHLSRRQDPCKKAARGPSSSSWACLWVGCSSSAASGSPRGPMRFFAWRQRKSLLSTSLRISRQAIPSDESIASGSIIGSGLNAYINLLLTKLAAILNHESRTQFKFCKEKPVPYTLPECRCYYAAGCKSDKSAPKAWRLHFGRS